MEYWSGKFITSLKDNEIFVFGSNPQGRHGKGAAKTAVDLFGAVYGIGKGLQNQSYAIVTKSLKAGFTDKEGITYALEGERSISIQDIKKEIDKLYLLAIQSEHKNKRFIITYQYDTYPNGTPKKSLNGYDSQEMLEMFIRDDIPPNIVFHDSYKPHLEKLLKNKTVHTEDNSPIAFTKVALPFGWMGNMAPYPVEHEGFTYKTTEALFQSLRFLNHPEIQETIRAQNSPMGAKMATKPHRHLLEADGFEMMGPQDVANMLLCVKLKLTQHPELAQQLIDTGNRPIIEDCTSRPQDSGLFWGSAYQNGQWIGKNVLGEILMQQRAELQKNMTHDRTNDTSKEYTYFFHLTSPFSNFHPAKIEYKGYTFISNEQFMMFSKAKNFSDEIAAQKILDLNDTPIARDFIDGKITREQIVNHQDWANEWNKLMMSVKKLGRGVQNYDDTIWTKKREKIVLFGARLKFSQNQDLKEILLSTGNTTMVEASKWDTIWGIGLSEYDAKKISPDKWPGLNLLGKVLDALKVEFQNSLTLDTKKKALEYKLIEVHNFYTLGKKIPEDGEYIGRANKNFNLAGSLFANPFPVYKPEEKDSSIGKFNDWLWQQIVGNKITKDDSTIEPEMTKEEFFGQLDINPLDYIRVVNVRGNKENQAQPDEKLIAAHRANPTLGNPFVMKDKSDAERDRVIEAYKKHLEKDLIAQGPIYKLLNKIADDIIEKKEKIALSCWCAPQACHAHEIAKILSLMIIEKLLFKPIESPKIDSKNKP